MKENTMTFILAANWKMNKSPKETESFFHEFSKYNLPDFFKIIFFIPSVNATTTAKANETCKIKFSWGPQNIYHQACGAFTGETSPQVMKNLGADFVLVGHSERRQLFKEDDWQANLKVKAAFDFKMTPILCVGEDLNERKKDLTMEVIKNQLERGLKDIEPKKELHIAYEPVWAIGTGETAKPEQIAKVHEFIRRFLKNKFCSFYQNMKILYGGSVKADNIPLLKKVPEVDGFLVGGASLEPRSFFDIIKALEKMKETAQ